MISHLHPEKMSEELRPAQAIQQCAMPRNRASASERQRPMTTKKKAGDKIKANEAPFTKVIRSKSPGR
jgi:hypothetical protein